MAAKIYAAPKTIKVPDFMVNGEFDSNRYGRDCEIYIREIRDWINATFPPDPYRGEEWRWCVADGSARYLLAQRKPLTLIHLDIVDGYNIDKITARGLTWKDVKTQIDGHRRYLREKEIMGKMGKRIRDITS